MNVLENFALGYFGSQEDGRALAYAFAILLGGVIAAITNRSEIRLARLPFFIRGALVLGLLAALQPIGRILAPTMIASGVLWLLMVIELVTCAAAGYALGTIAIARCRDGFGKHQHILAIAALAGILFSRLAFFVLLLKGTRTSEEGTSGWREASSAVQTRRMVK